MRTIIANFFALPCILQHTDTHRWCCRTETRWISMLYVVFILYGGNMKIKVRHYTFSSTTTRGISQYFGHAFFIILHTEALIRIRLWKIYRFENFIRYRKRIIYFTTNFLDIKGMYKYIWYIFQCQNVYLHTCHKDISYNTMESNQI